MSAVLHLVSRAPEETQRIGRILGAGAAPGDVFLLVGPLGAGKTCLVQGIAWGLGVEGHARSPTFVMAARYQGRLTLHHLDLFRVRNPEEVLDLGLEEYTSGGDVCVVEWADRASELFPGDSVWIALEYGTGETERLITIDVRSEAHSRLLLDLEGAGQADVKARPAG